MVEDHDRRGLRASRDIAAEHQHHAEFAQGVRERQHRSGDEAATRQWYRDREETIRRRRAQRRGDLERARAHRLKRSSAAAVRRTASNTASNPITRPPKLKLSGCKPS